jgi:hypothetical protein
LADEALLASTPRDGKRAYAAAAAQRGQWVLVRLPGTRVLLAAAPGNSPDYWDFKTGFEPSRWSDAQCFHFSYSYDCRRDFPRMAGSVQDDPTKKLKPR